MGIGKIKNVLQYTHLSKSNSPDDQARKSDKKKIEKTISTMPVRNKKAFKGDY